MKFQMVKDGVSADLRKRAAKVANKRPLLMAMGVAAQQLGKRAFTNPALRPSPWAPRQDDKPHPLLVQTPHLMMSLSVAASGNQVTISSSTPYAATHQLGSEKLNIPARPYLPFYQSGRLTQQGSIAVEQALRTALEKGA